MIDLRPGDCLEVLAGMAPESIDACVTDPPYHLASIVKRFGTEGAAPARGNDAYERASRGFMGKTWDGGDIAFRPETWAAVLRVLKPGAHLVAFGAPKNYHRLACAIEDAGFEVRDSLMWIFGSGFPKSQNVAKFLDAALGVEGGYGGPKSAAHAEMAARGVARRGEKHEGWDRPWMDDPEAVAKANAQYLPASEVAQRFDGWGTALKPAYEPIILARKPLIGTVAQNVMKHGTGAINIDATRVPGEAWKAHDATGLAATKFFSDGETPVIHKEPHDLGRWPANVVHDGSCEVLAGFPESKGQLARVGPEHGPKDSINTYGNFGPREAFEPRGDTGSAARFFYCAKASAKDRAGSKHPTVKPIALMRWLCRLVTPPGGLILDPFAGSGTTGQAAQEEGFAAVLIEREAEYQADIRRRLGLPEPLPSFEEMCS